MTDNAFAIQLFKGLPERYDALAEVLSFGQNGRWRRELAGHLASHRPRSVLDVATGTGGVAIALATETEASITGVDISDAMLERGRDRVRKADLAARIKLEPARAEALPYPSESFDAVSFTYLLRYVDDPAATVAELARVIRPGGHMASLDFYLPPNVAWRAAWWGYTRSLLPIAGVLLGGRAWWDVGRFLGPNIERHYGRWRLARIVDAWEAAGMVDVGCRVMSLGGGLVMWGTKS
ncbi:MAG TPA: class I SAM-dependent methyltransferase [Candidatus Dormibacteraeota bacterium]|nr:class I SAM-dependent methyltransferase [Candidatus Dormibacteraeota bacterium]